MILTITRRYGLFFLIAITCLFLAGNAFASTLVEPEVVKTRVEILPPGGRTIAGPGVVHLVAEQTVIYENRSGVNQILCVTIANSGSASVALKKGSTLQMVVPGNKTASVCMDVKALPDLNGALWIAAIPDGLDETNVVWRIDSYGN